MNWEVIGAISAFIASVATLLTLFYLAMQQHEHSLIDKVDYDAWLAYFVSNIKSPGGQKAWAAMKVSITPTVVAAAEKYMADNPNSPSWVELYGHRYRKN